MTAALSEEARGREVGVLPPLKRACFVTLKAQSVRVLRACVPGWTTWVRPQLACATYSYLSTSTLACQWRGSAHTCLGDLVEMAAVCSPGSFSA